MIFTTNKKAGQNYLRGQPVSLIILNIQSLAGGRTQPFYQSYNKTSAIKDKDGKIVDPFKDKLQKQAYNDGMLEFFSYMKTFDLGLGICNRVSQCPGPYIMKFKEPVSLFLHISEQKRQKDLLPSHV